MKAKNSKIRRAVKKFKKEVKKKLPPKKKVIIPTRTDTTPEMTAN